ncbi:cysteine proteinase [Westerdykella ornata]|uniref:ubiquitinyl hydrolase 1 n=1 Tax=Westerdykella ornata TaxID=318751 RepID=A0A6A6JQ06_WESOR|nr:cysteine proteinase [Westerdykella ornata]KAF2278334.1 cysteine proteinase [Westerdykella ornata]
MAEGLTASTLAEASSEPGLKAQQPATNANAVGEKDGSNSLTASETAHGGEQTDSKTSKELKASASSLKAYPSIEVTDGENQGSNESLKKRTVPDENVGKSLSSKRAKDEPKTPVKPGTPISPRFPSPPEERASDHDKEKWEGWCEIESDPAYMSAMIRMMGVKGVSVRQVFLIDADEMKALPHPIYGLIFLFRYRDSEDAEQQEKTCPDNVWFANQMPAQNSCATLAIMNILMNAHGVELGENLQQFKEFSSELSPYLRGEAFASFRFVKRIHNSFAKKMDMLEDDKNLAHKVEKNKSSGRRKSHDSNASEGSGFSEENAHHFIAFLPIDGQVWKLDGMDYQPTNLGPYDITNPDSWLEIASTRMMALMAAAGDQDYSVLSVVQSPVVGLRSTLLGNFASVKSIETRLDSTNEDWRSFLVSDGTDPMSVPITPSWLDSLGITQEQLSTMELSPTAKGKLDHPQMEMLIARRERLVKDQERLAQRIMEEMEVEAAEDENANERQWDYGPVIQKWLEMLANNGYLQENLERFMKK